MSIFSEGLEEEIWKLTKENEILKSKESQFESTIKATIAEKEKLASAYEKLRKDLEAESDMYFEQNRIMREALEEISIECDIEVNEDRREHNHGPTEAATTAREALEKCGSTEPMRKIITEAILNLDGQQARNKDNV